MKNLFYQKISLFLAFLIGLVIFFWSSTPGVPGVTVKLDILPIGYHLVVFFLFSAFLFLASWNKFNAKIIFLILILSSLYAGLDEFHQFFIPGRSYGFFDFGIDVIGILGSLIFVSFCKMFRK